MKQKIEMIWIVQMSSQQKEDIEINKNMKSLWFDRHD